MATATNRTILLGLCMALLAVPAVDAQRETTAALLTSSTTSITFQGAASVDGLILSHRQLDDAASPGLALLTVVHDATITRYDWNMTYVSALPLGTSTLPGQDLRPITSVRHVSSGILRLSDTPRGSAVLVQQARTILHAARDTLDVRTRVNEPTVRGDGGSSANGIRFVPLEMGTQRAPGSHLDLGLGPFEGNSTGPLSLYWYNATATLFADDATISLQASVWREPVDPSGVYWTQHRTWYELSATSAETDLWLGGADPGANDVVFAKAVSLDGVREIAIDSLAAGAAPDGGGAAQNHSALYLHGALRTAIRPAGDDDPDRQSYQVAYRGRVDGYSVGGGALVPVVADVTVVSLVAAALLALVAIKSLLADSIARLAAPLYTKLRKDDLLNLEARDSVYRLIQQSPGIHFLALHQQVRSAEGSPKIAYGALAYHLAQMERFDLIVSKREGRFRRYFDVGARIGADTARIALLQTQPIPVIARLILDNPGATQTLLQQRVQERVALTRQTLSYHLRRLVEKDLVVREAAGRFARYQPTQRLVNLAAYLEGTAPVDSPPPTTQNAVPAA